MQLGSANGSLTSLGAGFDQILVAGNVTGGILVPNSGGSLGQLSIGGDLLQSISIDRGGIGSISVSGNIGSVSQPVSIRAQSGITTIQAQAIWAQIDANQTAAGLGNGNITTILTTSGAFTGQLRANNLLSSGANQGIIVAGALNATLTLRGALQGRIQMASLGQQVIVNASNTGGAWTGPVTINGQALASPAYTQTSSAIGGGAVGAVPFRLHVQDSFTGFPQTAGGQTRLRFYGPIANSSGSIPVIVEYLDDDFSPALWYDISSNYTHTINGRDLTLTAINDFSNNGAIERAPTFRIRPRTNLVCSIPGGPTGVAVSAFVWQFTP